MKKLSALQFPHGRPSLKVFEIILGTKHKSPTNASFMNLNKLLSTALTALALTAVGSAISALGQNTIIEQAIIGFGSQTNNPDFVYSGFISRLTGDHSTAPGLVLTPTICSQNPALPPLELPPRVPGTNVVIYPNGIRAAMPPSPAHNQRRHIGIAGGDDLSSGSLVWRQSYCGFYATLSLPIQTQAQLASTRLPEPPAPVFKPAMATINGFRLAISPLPARTRPYNSPILAG